MRKTNLVSVCLFLIALVVMLPVCFAEEIRTTDGVTIQKSGTSAEESKNQKASVRQSAPVANVFP